MNQFCYEYARPALTSDIVLFKFSEEVLKVLLIQRAQEPYKDKWAFPGGFVDEGETAEMAAKRELLEETNLKDINLIQVFFDSELKRDPRGWTVSAIFLGYADSMHNAIAGDDAKMAKWFPLVELPELAFDHNYVFNKVINTLAEQIRFKVFGIDLLDNKFLENQISTLFTSILSDQKEADSIIKRYKDLNVLIKNGESYRFEHSLYNRVLEKGFNF